MFTMNKPFFLREFEYKNLYVYHSGRVVELLFFSNDYMTYKKAEILDKDSLSYSVKNNFDIKEMEVIGVKEKICDIHEYISDYIDYEIQKEIVPYLDKLDHKFNRQRSNQQVTKEDAKDYASHHVYLVPEDFEVSCGFAENLEEFKSFFESRVMYYFDEKEKKIKKEMIKPTVRIEEINFSLNGTYFKLDFVIEAFGRSWTSNDILLDNKKVIIDGLYESQEELIENRIKKLENQLDYFNSLKKGVKYTKGKVANF